LKSVPIPEEGNCNPLCAFGNYNLVVVLHMQSVPKKDENLKYPWSTGSSIESSTDCVEELEKVW